MYIFKSNINQKEYDHFVENHPSCSLLQSYKWANIKNNRQQSSSTWRRKVSN